MLIGYISLCVDNITDIRQFLQYPLPTLMHSSLHSLQGTNMLQNFSSIDLYVAFTYITIMRISAKKNRVFRVTQETFVADMEALNKFLHKSKGKIYSTYSANGYKDQEYIVEF